MPAFHVEDECQMKVHCSVARRLSVKLDHVECLSASFAQLRRHPLLPRHLSEPCKCQHRSLCSTVRSSANNKCAGTGSIRLATDPSIAQLLHAYKHLVACFERVQAVQMNSLYHKSLRRIVIRNLAVSDHKRERFAMSMKSSATDDGHAGRTCDVVVA